MKAARNWSVCQNSAGTSGGAISLSRDAF
ncbi:MAG: hypothetical protein ACRDQ4_02950 [Pseudonocardiaceae bacterium]